MPAWREIVQYLEHRHAVYIIAAVVAVLWLVVGALISWMRKLREQERRQHWMPHQAQSRAPTPPPRAQPRRRLPLR